MEARHAHTDAKNTNVVSEVKNPAENSLKAGLQAQGVEGMSAPTNFAPKEKSNISTTQGQFNLEQDKVNSGFKANGDGTYSVNGPDGQKYTVKYLDEHGKQVDPGKDPRELSHGGVKGHVYDAKGNLVEDTDPNKSSDIDSKVRDLLSRQDSSDQLAKLKLEPAQVKAFEGMNAALNKTPVDVEALTKIADGFSQNPEKFREVFDALLREHHLNPNHRSILMNGFEPVDKISFEVSTGHGRDKSWTHVQFNFPPDYQDKMYPR